MSQDLSAAPRLSEGEFGERVAWAVRRGVPQWLWPEVTTEAWQEALDSIERVSRAILTSGTAIELLRGEPAAVGVAAYTSGMGPLLGFWLSEGLLKAPKGTAELLEQHYQHNARRMERLADHAARVVTRLIEGGVPVTVMKGMHTAFACFPTLGTRPTSDIDLLIDPSRGAAARQILSELGYSLEYEATLPREQFWRHGSSAVTPQSLTLVHSDDPWGIDLHTSTNRRYAQASAIIRLDELACRLAPEGWILNRRARVMAPAATVLFLACHAGCGFGELRMLRLVELVLFIRQAEQSGAFSWDELVAMGELTATLPHAYAALHFAASLAPGAIPEHVLRQSRRDVPAAALRVIAGLTPATVHGITRCSVKERYMWTRSLSGKIRQLAHDLVPLEMPRSQVLPSLKRRLWRVVRGTLSVEASRS